MAETLVRLKEETLEQLKPLIKEVMRETLREEQKPAPIPVAPPVTVLPEGLSAREVTAMEQWLAGRFPEGLPTDKTQAHLEQSKALSVTGIVGQLDSMAFGIPLGSVLLGAVPGVIVGEVIDGLVDPKTKEGGVNWVNLLLKVILAVLAMQFLSGFLGKTPALFFAGALLIQILRQLLPIDDWVRSLRGLTGQKQQQGDGYQNNGYHLNQGFPDRPRRDILQDVLSPGGS